jgi:pyrimidine operon attenuation protein/uracil phosphoribosyltransferase
MTTRMPTGFRERQELMDKSRLARTLSRMAHEILEREPDVARTVLVGVRTRGVPLARRLAALMAEASGVMPVVGALDITLYRDDLTTVGPQPVIKGTDIPCSIDARTVVLVDDVLYTGRTVRAALDELIDFGRPARIKLAVLVDRGHRELPIRADFVGRTLTTTRQEIVQVELAEEDGADQVLLLERAPAPRPRPAPTQPRVAKRKRLPDTKPKAKVKTGSRKPTRVRRGTR